MNSLVDISYKKILFIGEKKEECDLVKEQLGESVFAVRHFAGNEFVKRPSEYLIIDASRRLQIVYPAKDGKKKEERVTAFKKTFRSHAHNALLNRMAKKVIVIVEHGEYWATVLVADRRHPKLQSRLVSCCSYYSKGPQDEKEEQLKYDNSSEDSWIVKVGNLFSEKLPRRLTIRAEIDYGLIISEVEKENSMK